MGHEWSSGAEEYRRIKRKREEEPENKDPSKTSPRDLQKELIEASKELVLMAQTHKDLPAAYTPKLKALGCLALDLEKELLRELSPLPLSEASTQTNEPKHIHLPRGRSVVTVEEGAQITFKTQELTYQQPSRNGSDEYPSLPATEITDWHTQTRRITKPKGSKTQPKSLPKPKNKEGQHLDQNGENKRKPPPVSLIIKADTATYAELLRKVKKEVDPRATGTTIAAIRETQKGDMSITLKGDSKGIVNFRNAIASKLQEAHVQLRGYQEVLHLKGLDSETTKEEVSIALKEALAGEDNLDEIRVSSIRPAHSHTQNATAILPRRLAIKLEAAGAIRVGWIQCKVQLRKEDQQRCFKCWRTGHISKDCTGEDRTKLCFNCGKDDHKAANCRKAPYCPLCSCEGHRAKASCTPGVGAEGAPISTEDG